MAMELESIPQVWSKQTGVHRDYLELASLVTMAKEKLNQAMAMELLSILLASVKQTEVLKVCLDMALLVFMERGKLNQAMVMEQQSILLASVKLTEVLKGYLDMALVSMAKEMLNQVMDMEDMELLLSLSPNLTMAMDTTHNLIPMDITLEVMEREMLSQVMELALLDMVLLLQLSILMVSVLKTEVFSLARERLNQVMELGMVLLPLPSIHMVVPAQITELPKAFPAMDIMVMESDQLNLVMESVLQFQQLVSQLSSKADHTTMVLMVTILTMFMERGLLNQDISMELIQANSMFQSPIPAMESMLPTPIKDC